MSRSTLQKLGAMGALGACGVLAAIYALFVWLALPVGIDVTESFIAIVAVGFVVLLIITADVIYARILLQVARGKEFGA
jgi:hypothetical protein